MFILRGLLVVLQFHRFMSNDQPPNHVVRGTFAAPSEFPYQAVLYRNGMQICGGSIIDRQWVVTAAHCCQNVGKSGYEWLVGVGSTRLGDEDEVTYGVIKGIRHPKYVKPETGCDIALLKVKPITFNKDVGPVKLAENKYPEGKAVVSGFGVLRSGGLPSSILMKANLEILDHKNNKKCRKDAAIDQICAWDPTNWSDACQGDSGGPVVANHKQHAVLIGVVSWGRGCGKPYSPAFYTHVGFHRQWIRKVMSQNSGKHGRLMDGPVTSISS